MQHLLCYLSCQPVYVRTCYHICYLCGIIH
nr:MAG TPA: hypothetical protein [Caudoviricetes sp.]